MFRYALINDKQLPIFGPPRSSKLPLSFVASMLAGNKIASVTETNAQTVFGEQHLPGKKMILIPDATVKSLSKLRNLLKRLSGGDPYPIQVKFERPLSYTPHCPIIVTTTDASIFDNDAAMTRRVASIDCPAIATENVDPNFRYELN